MPTFAPKPCLVCHSLVADGSTRCAAHKVKAGSFADRGRGSSTARGYGWAWAKLRQPVLEEEGGLCQPCLRDGHVTPNCNTVDHRVPKAQGGTDARPNLQTICGPCHAEKTAAEALLGRLGAIPDATVPRPAGVGAGQISGASGRMTDRFVKFSRAGYTAGGGT